MAAATQGKVMTIGGLRGALAFGALTIAMVLAGTAAAAPSGDDAYRRLVARAEAGDTTLDFRALRLAWITSAQHHYMIPDDLRREIAAGVQGHDAARVAAAARKIIAGDYIEMSAHKYLRQACTVMGDTGCANHEHFVEFGLLQSITSDRNGQSKATAWRVVSIEEEYFIMGMADMTLQTQSLIQDPGRQYDRMDVVADGQKRVVWFDITDFFSHELD